MKCPICRINNAVYDEYYGYLPCDPCKKRQNSLKKPNSQVEFTTSDIKTQRKAYADDILQPYRKGELSKEYIERYGTKRLKVSKAEAKKARYTWNDLSYYKKHE